MTDSPEMIQGLSARAYGLLGERGEKGTRNSQALMKNVSQSSLLEINLLAKLSVSEHIKQAKD